MFVDQVGSTARADGADPEDVRDRNRLFYDETLSRIERHGGVVEKYVGDAVMAVFGAPRAHSDDAERAVRAGLSVLDGITGLNGRHPDLRIQVRIGICTGSAVVQIDPPPGSALATGDVVNTAARLQSAAPVGRVIVDPETHRLTRDAFGYEEVAPIEAKGKREPLAAWIVGDVLAAPSSRPASRTPIVGRDRELQLIQSLWERAADARRPQLISILGPPGIGKSRLARDVSTSLEQHGARVLWGRSLPYDEQTPYHAAGEMVRRVATIFENDPSPVAREKVSTLIASILPAEEAPDLTRYLSLLLGLGLDNAPLHGVHLQFAMRRLIERLSEDQPLLLVFDDMHWADDALIDLIDYLSSHLREHPVVLMVLARPEFFEGRAGWGGGLLASTTLPLEPLTPQESSEVVSSLLSEAREETVAKLVATAEGNPLFIEELAASHAETEPSDTLPSTIRAVIAGRIDALPQDARTALLHASVVGRTFWREILRAIGDLDELDAGLEALELRGFIRRNLVSNVRGDAEFAFKHDLVRDVSYETIPRAKRLTLHAATARALEHRVGHASEVASVLAYHWREAGDSVRALGYLHEAADRARDALALADMNELYDRALEIAATEQERITTQLRRGLAFVRLGEEAAADACLAQVIPLLDGDDEVEALVARSRACLWTELADQAITLAEHALQLAENRGPEDLVAPAMALLSSAYGSRGASGDLERAMDLGEKALDIWIPGTRPHELAEAYHMHANTNYWVGEYEKAARLSRQSREAAGMRPTSSEFRLRGVGQEGLALAGLGRYEEAIKVGDDAIAIALELGQTPIVVKNYSTLPLREIFAVDEARDRSQQVIDTLGGPADFNMPWMNARADLLQAIILRGELSLAEKQWPNVWEEAQQSRSWEHWLVSGRLASARAELELELGRLDDAIVWADRALEMATAGARRKYATIARTLLGRALVARRDAEGAVPHLRVAVETADALRSPLLRWQARVALASALERSAVAGERDAARSEAVQIIREVVASLSAEHAAAYRAAPAVGQVLDQAGVRLE